MLGSDEAFRILDLAISHSAADQTAAMLSAGDDNLTRYADNVIHQNTAIRNAELTVKAVIGKRIGVANANQLDEPAIRATVDRAVEFAKAQVENPDFVSLPGPQPITPVDAYDEATATAGPESRADAVAAVVAEARSRNATVSGAFSTGHTESAVVNSLGVRAYEVSSSARLSSLATAGTGFGWADRTGWKADFDFPGVGVEAAERAVSSRDPQLLDAGEYDVILLPYAVQTLIGFLSRLAFSSMAYQEGRGAFCDRLGEKVCHESVTIWDDASDPDGIPSAFDAEGLPIRRLELITDGVARGIAYDSYTAKREGKESTGHAASGAWLVGGYPRHLQMAPGDSSVDEMIADTKEGVLVTRFHYSNVIHEKQTVVTGMTRDGTFLIRDGKIAHPVRNLRYTQSVLEAMSKVRAISAERKLGGRIVCPALKIANFRFTGTTEF